MYESDQSTVTTTLAEKNPAVFTPDVIAQIMSLSTGAGDSTVSIQQATPDANGNVTVPAGTEVVFVTIPDGVDPATITPPPGAKVVIFQGSGGVTVVFNDNAANAEAMADSAISDKAAAVTPDRIVVASEGKDSITIGDSKNSLISVGDGDTVVAGGGNDTIVAGTGHSTISGGTGHAIVQLSGNAADYVVVVGSGDFAGHALVANKATNNTFVDITKIQYVDLDGSQALVFAKDSLEASVATMFHTVFGRDAVDGELQTSFSNAHNGMSLTKIAESLLLSPEYTAKPVQSDLDFVKTLYLNTFGREGDEGGIDHWMLDLNAGQARADVVANFDRISGANLDGTLHTEPTIMGSVTIVHNIV
jgi:Ca2+-binding RTX toxin-like protein